jgi:hypothetical protein
VLQAIQAAPFVAQVWSVNSVRQVSPAQQASLQVSASQPDFEHAAPRIIASASNTASAQPLIAESPCVPNRY